MSTTTTSDPHGHHDWHSADYVDHWISSDATRDDERRAWLRRVARMIPFDREEELRVLDVGAGYGMLSREVLDAFPASHVVLHDFSAPMTDHARQRLADAADRISFVVADLRDEGWTDGIDGPFHAVVSAIAIHNVRDTAVIRRIYADIRPLVAPGGCFYNMDFVMAGGPSSARALGHRGTYPERTDDLPTLANHLAWTRDAGFDEAECLLRIDGQTVVAGFVSG